MAAPPPKVVPPPTLKDGKKDDKYIKNDARESLTYPNWRWRSFDTYDDNVRYPPQQKRLYSATSKGPFEVMSVKKSSTPWPEVVHIALFSRPLIQILEAYLPSIRDLKSLAVPIIAGRELYFVLDSLKQHKSHVGGEFQVQPVAANQIVNGEVTSSEEASKNEESPKTQNSSAEERAPEHTEAQGGAFKPATSDRVADAAVMSSSLVRSKEDSPKAQNLSVEERAPKHTEAQGVDFQSAAANQIADEAVSKSEGVRRNEDSPRSQNSSAEETGPKHSKEQSGDFQTAAANQSVDGALMSSEVVCNNEDSPKSQTLNGKDTAPKHIEAQTVRDKEFHKDASIGTEKLGTKHRPPKGYASTSNHCIKGEGWKDEVSLSNKDTGSRGPKAPPPVITEEEIGLCHLKHLVRCLEEEYEDVPETVRRMREKEQVAWDMLWAFLPRGAKVVYYSGTSNDMVCAEVSENYYEVGKNETLVIKLAVWDYDGNRYRKCQNTREILKYKGEKSFSDLAVCPAKMMGTPKQSNEEILARGKMFHELVVRSTRRFMHYSGTMFVKSSGSQVTVHKYKADGRVMIDLKSFAEMNPRYPMGNARQQTSAILSSKNPICGDDSHAVSNDSLISSPAIVYGFSFALNKWGAFSLTGLSEITFNKSAFDDLVMAQDKKALVYNLVSQCVTECDGVSASEAPGLALEQVDPITQKGEGCVFLCYGLSGSGKSLTAESIAESLERPLWDVRVSDLRGLGFETELKKIADIAARWQAILLINEADIFLQKRTSSCVLSNPWTTDATAAFLRILEYNQGVMFLTMNRTGAIDEAFRTRISVFLRYKEVSAEDKQKLWRTLLTKGAVEGVTDEICGELATRDCSGREIKNAIRTARLWAKSIGKPVAAKHVKYVMEMRASSLACLNDDLGTPDLELNEFVHL